jgi:hypothetical protein
MAVKLNDRAFERAKEVIKKGHFVADEKGIGANTSHRPNRRMNSFASMDSANT